MGLHAKLNATLIILVICLVLLISASYAWFVMSRSPEVTSIDTNIGANGSLEIALLSDETYIDPAKIRTAVGDSAMVQDVAVSNLAWGNVIDLTGETYGLNRISLLPARLNLLKSGDQAYSVPNNMLMIADFGIDGRIRTMDAGTVSTIFGEGAFTYHMQNQHYGVRAIGTISNISFQQRELAAARSAVQSYLSAAKRGVESVWKENGSGFTSVLFQGYYAQAEQLTKEEIAIVRDMADKLLDIVDYIDSALRQGMIGIVASQIAADTEFISVRDTLSNKQIPLSVVVETAVNPPSELKIWITQLEQMEEELQDAIRKCNAFGGTCSWEQMEPLLKNLIDTDKAYMGEYLLSSSEAYSEIRKDNVLTLAPYSGIMSGMAAYIGNYSTFYTWVDNIGVEVLTTDTVKTPYLLQLSQMLEECKAAQGNWTFAQLDTIYGYAIDMAFRCNTQSDLLLQTEPEQRVAGETSATQGGGSYMRFFSEHMDTEELLNLMDTIRVGFLDDKNTLIALAKLNTSNYEVREDGVFAPLYLYAYTVEENGSISTGARKDKENRILPLAQNQPTVLTAVVWMDGDQVNNSMVHALTQRSMGGVLNLQFSSSVDLKPADFSVKNK